MKKIFLASVFVLLIFLSSCGSNNYNSNDDSSNGTSQIVEREEDNNEYESKDFDDSKYYIITFKNYDGTILQTDSVKYGEMPSYRASNPIRVKDGNYSYTFNGWTPLISKASANAEYTATYSQTAIPCYSITFKNYDGTVLQNSYIKEGQTPSYNESNPIRENDETYSYTFNGWTPEISEVSGETIYVAKYTQQLLPYNVTINFNGGTSQTTKLQFRTDKISKDILPFDVKKKGYIFKGYELNNVKVYDENGNSVNNYLPSANMTFKAIYEESVELTVFYTIYNPKTNELIKTFDSKPSNLGNISETRRYNYNTYVDLFAYPSEGYTFEGWYTDGQVLSNLNNYKYMMWDEDLTIEARFKYTSYDLNVWSNNEALGQVMIRNGNSQIFYNEETLKEFYNESVTVVAYSNTNTTRFLGWYDENNNLVSPKAVYTFNMLNRDYKLEAKWDFFNVTYDLDGGINNVLNPTYYTIDMQNITLLEPIKEEYTFVGWTYKDNFVTEINTANICHMKLEAVWTYYTLTTSVNNEKAGSVTSYNETKITKGKLITIEATTNPGYTFIGWYDGDNEISKEPEYTFDMPFEDVLYVARYVINKYKITIVNSVENVTITGVVSGEKYDFGTEIILNAHNVNSVIIEWRCSDNQIYGGNEYKFTVPSEDVIINVEIANVVITTKKVFLGTYPQSRVVDDDLIIELNDLAGNVPDSLGNYGWKHYDYYTGDMYYQDVDYDNDGYLDFRGIYIKKYRSDSYAQSVNGYFINNIYWFKYEPIEWDVLEEKNGMALILSNVSLDSYVFNHTINGSSTTEFYHNVGTGYANDYKLSDVRNWLISDFYNIAFSDIQKDRIETTIIDNNIDVKDKVFLLSYKEAQTFYSTCNLNFYGTDYARCQCFEWTFDVVRDVHYRHDLVITVSYYNGEFFSQKDDVVRTNLSIRPACWISL